jgi:hypothetical protein
MGGVSRPQVGWLRRPARGPGASAVLQNDSARQSRQWPRRNHAFELQPVGLLQFVARVADPLLQATVIAEQE